MIPQNLEKAEMLSMNSEEKEKFEIEFKLFNMPEMKPSEQEIISAAERGITCQEQRRRHKLQIDLQLDDKDKQEISYNKLMKFLKKTNTQ